MPQTQGMSLLTFTSFSFRFFGLTRTALVVAVALIGGSITARADDAVRFEGTGRGGTEAQALAQAYQVALRDLLMREFPARIEVAEHFLHTLSGPVARGGVSIESPPVELKGMRLVKSHIHKERDEFIAHATYVIPRRLFETARSAALLKARQPTESVLQKSLRENLDPHRADLSVETSPPGALVSLKEMGFTLPSPVNLQQFVEPGQITLRIDHPEYEPLEEVHEVQAGGRIAIQRTLKRAQVQLKLMSVPKGATIWINGKKQGQTPAVYTHRVGESLRVELQHPQTEAFETELSITREPEFQMLEFQMKYKPTYLQILAPARPTGRFYMRRGFSTVTLKPQEPIAIEPGDREICFETASGSSGDTPATRCGNRCCQNIIIQPGQMNYVSFHEQLSPPVLSPTLRQIDASGGERAPRSPAPSTTPIAAASSEDDLSTWLLSRDEWLRLNLVMTYESKINPHLNLDLTGLGMEFEIQPFSIAYVATSLGGLSSNAKVSEKNVGPENSRFIDWGGGLRTPDFNFLGRASFIAYEWRGVQRYGDYYLPHRVNWSQTGQMQGFRWFSEMDDWHWSMSALTFTPHESRGLLGHPTTQWRISVGGSW